MAILNSRKVSDLHPVVEIKCNEFIKECKKAGITIQVISTLRNREYQEWLYAQGRTRPGNIVTNMKNIGPHAYGLAFDVVPVVNGKAVWNDKDLWSKVGKIGKKLGFEWGGDWTSFPDKPHFQYCEKLTASQLNAGKRPSFWKYK